jgi:hypothetical protein
MFNVMLMYIWILCYIFPLLNLFMDVVDYYLLMSSSILYLDYL